MVESDRDKYLFKESAGSEVNIDITNCTVGNSYVLVAYYNQTGISGFFETYVVRASDNVIKFTRNATGVTTQIIPME